MNDFDDQSLSHWKVISSETGTFYAMILAAQGQTLFPGRRGNVTAKVLRGYDSLFYNERCMMSR